LLTMVKLGFPFLSPVGPQPARDDHTDQADKP
jgi:hypothetical protein